MQNSLQRSFNSDLCEFELILCNFFFGFRIKLKYGLNKSLAKCQIDLKIFFHRFFLSIEI